MERLTHDSYVVQAARLPQNRSRDKLNELLSIFEQRKFTNAEKTEKRYPYEPEHEEVREMCRTLSSVIADPKTRKQLHAELEYYRQRAGDAREDRVKLEEAKKEIAEAKKEITETKKEITETKAALAAKEQEVAALQRQIDELSRPNKQK
jgi:DNA repair ATPase RecN